MGWGWGCGAGEFLSLSLLLPGSLQQGCSHCPFCHPIGLQHQGIFRVSGSQVEVNDIKNSFERGNWMSLPISKTCWKTSLFCFLPCTLNSERPLSLQLARASLWELGMSYCCEKQKSLWAWSLGLGFTLTGHGMCQGGTWQDSRRGSRLSLHGGVGHLLPTSGFCQWPSPSSYPLALLPSCGLGQCLLYVHDWLRHKLD